jgi:beta-glucosidase
MNLVGRQMQNRKFGFYLLCTVIAAFGTIIATPVLAGSSSDNTPLTASLVVR